MRGVDARTRVADAGLWYYEFELPQRLDIALLRPTKYNDKGKNEGFETVGECISRIRKHITVLEAKGAGPKSRSLAAKLRDCVRSVPCGSSACNRCNRERRRALTGRALAHARRYLKHGLIPIFLTVVFTDPSLRHPKLAKTDPAKLRQRFRMLLRREGLAHVPMIGGFETDYNDRAKVWEPHGHFVAFVSQENELDPIRRHFSKAHGVSRPFEVKPRDPDRIHEAIAYCWKFSPMKKFRVRRWDRKRQKRKYVTRKVPLRGPKLRRALIWLDKRNPAEFLFFQRLKLVGSKLIRI